MLDITESHLEWSEFAKNWNSVLETLLYPEKYAWNKRVPIGTKRIHSDNGILRVKTCYILKSRHQERVSFGTQRGRQNTEILYVNTLLYHGKCLDRKEFSIKRRIRAEILLYPEKSVQYKCIPLLLKRIRQDSEIACMKPLV